MSNQENRWTRVGAAIKTRAEDELGWTSAEFERQSGISYKTLQRYMAGVPIVRRDKRRSLTAALGWTFDSIDRILAGGEPQQVTRSIVDQVAQAHPGHEYSEAVRDELRRRQPTTVAEATEIFDAFGTWQGTTAQLRIETERLRQIATAADDDRAQLRRDLDTALDQIGDLARRVEDLAAIVEGGAQAQSADPDS